MSPIDAEQRDVEQSVDEGEMDNSRFVPVTESIRYRRRAQSAEKKNELLTEELASVKTQGEQMQRRLKELELEGSLMRRLAGAGVVDLETAVLLAKARCEGQEKIEPEDVIEQLKREKQYLFGQGCGASFVPGKTSGARERATGVRSVLERAAKRAAGTGSRADLQEYLKLRRNFH